MSFIPGDDDQQTRRGRAPSQEPRGPVEPPRPPDSTVPRRPPEPTRIHAPIPPEPPRPDPRSSGLYVPWWGFAVTILVVAGLTCGLWAYVLSNQGASADIIPTPTPIFVVITATPTLGPAPESALPTQPAAEVVTEPTAILPTEPPTSTAPPIPIVVGARVAVAGTEGSGLAVRQGPGTSFTYFFVANDGEVYVVQDGPRDGDGYVWWYIQDPNDANRAGWAASIFLVVQP